MTPLWVISLFLSLTEIMTGIAVMQATGNVQVALTAFVITFPCIVSAAFFVVLWKRPYVFYPPTEFGPQTDVTKYVEAMRRVQSNEVQVREVIQEAIKATLESPQALERISVVSTSQAPEILKQLEHIRADLAREAISKAEESFVSVDTQRVTGRKSPSVFPFDESLTVNQFLDQVYFALEDGVPPYQYANIWMLRDAKSGREYREIGTRWARDNGRRSDTRLLKDVGIAGGAKLEVIRLREAV
jgi:hypothetical protein